MSSGGLEPAAGAAGRRPDAGHLLHVFPSFGLGGVPIRIASIIDHLGQDYRHTILALDGNHDSRCRIDPGLQVAYKVPSGSRYNLWQNVKQNRRVISELAPDLMLTYNWGAIEWALANRFRPLCRHIHLESGFGVEESEAPLLRRVLFRRFALKNIDLLIVPSRTLVDLASEVWRLPARKIRHIPNGVEIARFEAGASGALPDSEAWPGDGVVVIGTLAPLRPEKNVGRLIRAFGRVSTEAKLRLMVVGEGPERAGLEELARDEGCADRIIFTGHVEAVETVLSRFDVFALSSDTEQMPNSLLQAMAAGCAVASVDVGDVKRMVAPENRTFVVPKTDADLASAFERLVKDADLRRALGQRNKAQVRAHYSAERMYAAYAEALIPRSADNDPFDGARRPAGQARPAARC